MAKPSGAKGTGSVNTGTGKGTTKGTSGAKGLPTKPKGGTGGRGGKGR